jgi:alkanesulfonate monooxygenase SsuD/methylene tetrahydromethanopterin reductase-like flavin-dependent oxidoreductase (luciferase family)
VFSGGRLILGLGAGWYEREYQAYGFPFPRPGVRLQILEETVEVVKRLWAEETVTYQGKHLAFDGAYCDPKPLQQLPELWIGGGGEKVTLRIEARHADKTNWQTGLANFVRKSELLRQYCDEVGRDFGTIVRTHGPDCRIFESDRDLHAWLESPTGGSLRRGATPHDEYVRDNFVGTVEQVTEKVQAYVDAGCGEFVLWFRDFPSSASLETFAREVIPRVHA